jgi:zinc protease
MCGQAFAKPPAKSAAPRKVTEVEGLTEYALDNGLRVLLFPDRSKPTVTVNVTYFVGSRVEGYGESGMAHLLEHMVFKGTPQHPKIWDLLQDHGAQFNGSTWVDRTNYYETMPASSANLKFALELEADRMINSKIAGEDLAKEFSVVRNEFERGENNPTRVLGERMLASAYIWHNYGKSTIGSRSDIERVPVDNLRDFYKRYYQPDNAMLVVAGKFDPAEALKVIGDTFGKLQKPTRKLPTSYTVEPLQDGERVVYLRRSGDTALVGLGYHSVAGSDTQYVAAEALADILTNKPAGRVYKQMVQTGLVAGTRAYSFAWAEPGMFNIGVEINGAHAKDEKYVGEMRDKLVAIAEGVGKQPITEEEVKRWKTAQLADIELALTDPARIGVELSEWAAMGDWRMMFLHRDRVEALKPAEVTKFAQDFLKTQNRTTGIFVPTATPERAAEASRQDVAAMVKDYKGRAAVKEGENFEATIANIEKRVVRGKLSNGMKTALLSKSTRGEAVRMIIRVHAGSETALNGKAGDAATLVTTMLLRGSKKHNYQQLSDELDRLKAEVAISSDSDLGGGGLRVLTTRANLPAVISLMAEVFEQPAFSAAEFETLRKETLAGLESQLQNPQVLGAVALQQKAQPYAATDVRYSPMPKERIERLKALKVEDIAKFHAEQWGGSSGEIAVVGDFDSAQVGALLEKEFGHWKSAAPYKHVKMTWKDGVAAAEEVIKTPDKPMAFVAVALAFPLRDDDADYPALRMFNFILGGSAKSRLLDRLRQKEGLSYGAFSSVQADSIDALGGMFAGAICAKQNAAKSILLLREELGRLVGKGVDAKELADAKTAYQNTFDNQLANDDFVASQLARLLFVGRTFDFWGKVNTRMASLKPADLVAAAQKHVSLGRLQQVTAGDL